MPPRSAYVHVPFCRHRCGYCNFTLIAGRDDLIRSYLEALEIELQSLGGTFPVDTLYLGGGTPSHLPMQDLDALLRLVTSVFEPGPQSEFTVEANPSDVDRARLGLLAGAGVNRISLGAQSFDPQKLSVLERDHDRARIESAVQLTKTYIGNLSLDLIFGVPGENRTIWQGDLQAALALEPHHLSTYGLTFERGTRFWSRRHKNELSAVEDRDEAWMYRTAMECLEAAGMEHYEVSSFARPGFRSRHNQVYWTGGEYFAAGPGASRLIGNLRETNHRSTTTYLRRVLSGQSPVAETELLCGEDLARERLVLALRRLEGVDDGQFTQETGHSIHELVGRRLPEYIQRGWMTWSDGRLSLTREGVMFSDAIWPDFL